MFLGAVLAGAAEPSPKPAEPSPALQRKLRALGLIYKEAAAQAEASAERGKLYAEFLAESEPVLKELPQALNLWVLRAAIGLETNDAMVA